MAHTHHYGSGMLNLIPFRTTLATAIVVASLTACGLRSTGLPPSVAAPIASRETANTALHPVGRPSTAAQSAQADPKLGDSGNETLAWQGSDRKSTRLNSSHSQIS